jgi:D-glycero-D-manno-heptose 1,7-bisphosphate phosphatase
MRICDSEESCSKPRRQAAAFLDRDGVLNVDQGYVHRPDQWIWTVGAVEAVRLLNEHGYRVIVVTNQSGIARGYFGEGELHRLVRWTDRQLAAAKAHIDATYYCPHHPTEGNGPYTISCSCRKPAPGLILQAMRDWRIDVGQSFLIGDRESDLRAARAAGIRGYLFRGGSLHSFVRSLLYENTLRGSA